MQELLDWLKKHGLNFNPILDKEIHRFSVDEDDGDAGWYIGSSGVMPSGKTIITLTVSSWKWSEKLYFRSGGFNESDLKHYKEQLSKNKKEQEEAQEQVHKEAAAKAKKIWELAGPTESFQGQHPYLERKKVGALGIRALRENLIIPVRDKSGEIQSLQRIYPDGKKLFLGGGKTKGGFFKINGITQCVLVCEGYATGASLSMATGFMVYVAFNAGNLVEVSKIVRELHGGYAKIIVCGDDDRFTEIGNKGRECAEAAALAAGGGGCFP